MDEEVTEKSVISVTPGSSKLNVASRRNSTGKGNTSASPSLSNSDGIPHYLRASTGSCHDFCKYGRKHEHEAKKKGPILPSFLRNNFTATEEDNQVRVPVLRERRKKLEVKLKQPRNEVSSGSKVTKQKDLSLTTVTPFAQPDKSSEDMLSISSVEYIPSGLAEGTSEESVSIKLMVPSSCMASDEYGLTDQAGIVEEAMAMQLGTPSPTIKSVITAERIPLACESSEYAFGSPIEMSTKEPEDIVPMAPSPLEESVAFPRESLANELERSLKNSAPLEESVAFPRDSLTNELERSLKNSASLKAQTLTSCQESTLSSGHSFSDLEAGVSDRYTSMKSPYSPPIQKSSVPDKRALPNQKSSVPDKRALPNQKSSVPDKRAPSSHVEISSVKSVTSKLKSRIPVQKTNLTAKHAHGNIAGISSEEQDRVTSPCSIDQKKRQVTQLNSAPQLQNVVSVRAEFIGQKNIDASGQPSITKKNNSSPVKKTIMSSDLKQTKQKSPSFKRTVVSGTPKTLTKINGSPRKGVYVPVKSAISLKPNYSMVKSTSLFSSGGLTDRRNQKNRVVRSFGASQTGEEKLLRTPKASVSPNSVNMVSSLKLNKFRNSVPVSPLKNGAKVANREHGFVKEKMLHVIQPKEMSIDLKHVQHNPRKVKSSPSPQSSPSVTTSSSPSVSSHGKDKHTDCDSVFSEATGLNPASKRTSKKPAAVQKVDNKERLRKNTVVRLADNKPPSPHKLKFRRGKIVNLQPENSGPRRLRFRSARPLNENLPENSGPRRLRFRSARPLNENLNEVVKRSFRKRRESSEAVADPPISEATTVVFGNRREPSSAAMDPAVTEAPAVVLRHQGVLDKKDNQGLFNNVIEETAKQLVESRKSKVKALVGAFETVISLQESKVGPAV